MNINDFKGLSPELIEFETTDTNVVMSLLELNQSVSLFMEGDVCLMAQGDGLIFLISSLNQAAK
jgi:hypothetical protein